MAERPRPATYLALGDSLAVGVGATPMEWQSGYVGRFNRYLQDSRDGPHRLLNIGVSGETSSSFIYGGQLAAAVAAINDPENDIQTVTLDIGGNDLLALLRPNAPCVADPGGLACQQAVVGALALFGENYGLILATLASALQDDPATVMVMTYYNPFDGTGSPFEAPIDVALLGFDGTIDCAAGPQYWGMNDLIACGGAAAGVRVVDVYPLFAGNAMGLTHVGSGDIHPNDDGYALIAGAFAATVR
jgi:lysophospholipase L1-like esterase